MQNDLDNRSRLDDRTTGMGGGTIAAIIAAVLILGALFLWAPWNGPHNNAANNTSSTTTTGSASTNRPAGPATTPAAPSPSPAR
jgi:cell division protein FtsN